MPRKAYHEHFRFKKRNGIYYVLYRTEPGRPRSTGQITEEEAVAWAFAHLGEKPHRPLTLREFAKGFFLPETCNWSRRMLKKGRTYSVYYFQGHRSRLNCFILPKFGPLTLTAITTKSIDEWLMNLVSVKTKQPLAPASKGKVLATLRIILGEAKYQGFVDTNAAAEVEPFRGPSFVREPFTIEELHKFFPDNIDEMVRIWGTPMWCAFFYIMATCGLRPGEVAAIRWGDWKRQYHGAVISGSIENRTGNRKGLKTEKKGVEVKPAVFTDRAEQLLLLLESQTESTNENNLIFTVKGRPLLTETILKHLRSSANRCDVDLDGRTSYCFRHTFNTHLAKSISLNQLQTAMGHVTMSSSKRYLHPKPEDLLEQAAPVRGIVESVFGKHSE